MLNKGVEARPSGWLDHRRIKAQMKKWEYKFITHEAKGFNSLHSSEGRVDEFNHLGVDGWELVTMMPATEWAGALVKYIFVFKREIEP
jgi:hypothetical protein